ncbi:MAG: hypothetical protein ACRD0G_20310 [Acidimicrobiales bacterium]
MSIGPQLPPVASDDDDDDVWPRRRRRRQRRNAVIVLLVGGVAVVGLVLGLTGAVGWFDDDERNTTAVEREGERSVVDTYRVVYDVTEGRQTTTVEVVVNRPFAGLEEIRPTGGGATLGERFTAFGHDLAREPGESWSGTVGVPGPALGEPRFDATLRDVLRVGLLVEDPDTPGGEIAGRSCDRYLAGAPFDEPPEPYDARGERRVSLCLDDETGLVLEELVVEKGTEVRRTTARRIELDVDIGNRLRPPTPPAPLNEGGGLMNEVRPDERASPLEAWRLPTPGSFRFIGRRAYVRPTPPPAPPQQLAQTVDVFLRDTDGQEETVLLFQGIDPELPEAPSWAETAELDGDAGTVTEIVWPGFNEIRLESPDDEVVARLVGTVPMSELRGLARTVETLGPAQPTG